MYVVILPAYNFKKAKEIADSINDNIPYSGTINIRKAYTTLEKEDLLIAGELEEWVMPIEDVKLNKEMNKATLFKKILEWISI